DVDAAMRLYWWNVEISAAFFGPLHCVELALRNALNARLVARYGRPDWWVKAPLGPSASDAVASVEAKLRRRVGAVSADDVVAGHGDHGQGARPGARGLGAPDRRLPWHLSAAFLGG